MEKKQPVVRAEFEEGMIARLEQTFQALDANGDGRLSKEELQAVCGDNKQVDKIFASMDVDGDGGIDLTEFMAGFSKLQEQPEAQPPKVVQLLHELDTIFDFVDTDHSGTISFEELVKAAEVSGIAVSEIDVLKIREAFDMHCTNEELDFERFKEVFLLLRCPNSGIANGTVEHQDQESFRAASKGTVPFETSMRLTSLNSSVYVSDGDPALLEAKQEIHLLEQRLCTALNDRAKQSMTSDELRGELEVTTQENASLKAKVDRLEGIVALRSEELAAVKVDLELTVQELNEALSKHGGLIQDNAELLRVVNEHARTIRDLKEDKQALQETLDDMDKASRSEIISLVDRQQLLNSELKTKEASWEARRVMLENELDSLRQQVEQLKEERLNFLHERDDLQASVKSLSEALNRGMVNPLTPTDNDYCAIQRSDDPCPPDNFDTCQPQPFDDCRLSVSVGRGESLADEIMDSSTSTSQRYDNCCLPDKFNTRHPQAPDDCRLSAPTGRGESLADEIIHSTNCLVVADDLRLKPSVNCLSVDVSAFMGFVRRWLCPPRSAARRKSLPGNHRLDSNFARRRRSSRGDRVWLTLSLTLYLRLTEYETAP